MASILVNAYDNSIALLYNSDSEFTFPILIAAAIIIFFCANLAAGLGLSGGMVQPMFLVGGVWGRLVGLIIHSYITDSATPGLYLNLPRYFYTVEDWYANPYVLKID